MNRTPQENHRLIESVHALVWQCAWASWSALPPALKGFLDVEDLVQEGFLALWKEAWRWDASRGRFTTFAAMVVRTHYMTLLARWKALKRFPGTPIDFEDWSRHVALAAPPAADPEIEDRPLSSWFGT